ncbi:MAG: Maf family protein [Lachnospiraceae bacterium]|nr:Maf family protein [Lachnospiraceae bacterium]
MDGDDAMGKRIILASGSPRRRELLTQIGVSFEVHKAEGEEKLTTDVPQEVVRELSMQKAREVAGKVSGDLYIGADTVVAVDGQILGKPKDEEDAVRMLRLLQGRAHDVATGVAVIFTDGQEPLSFAETTRVHVFPMTEEEICAYVQSGEPMDKAGAYGIQGLFAAYVSGIEGDYNNVVGLPVGRLYQELRVRGIDLRECYQEEQE